jgi:hypothetical protein
MQLEARQRRENDKSAEKKANTRPCGGGGAVALGALEGVVLRTAGANRGPAACQQRAGSRAGRALGSTRWQASRGVLFLLVLARRALQLRWRRRRVGAERWAQSRCACPYPRGRGVGDAAEEARMGSGGRGRALAEERRSDKCSCRSADAGAGWHCGLRWLLWRAAAVRGPCARPPGCESGLGATR